MTTNDLIRTDYGFEYHGSKIFVPVSLGDAFTIECYDGISFASLADAMRAIDSEVN